MSLFLKVMWSEINPVGEKLDPNSSCRRMSLIASSDTVELNTLVNVIQKGYKSGDEACKTSSLRNSFQWEKASN